MNIVQMGVQRDLKNYLESGLKKAVKYRRYMKGIPNTTKGRYMASILGHCYENLNNFIGSFQEETRLSSIGSFPNYGFPMLRAVLPNLNAINLVTVQPIPGPNAYIYAMQFLVGSNKGSMTKGEEFFSGLKGNPETGYAGFQNYTSENIDSELIGTGNGTQTRFVANLSWLPIRPGTVTVKSGNIIVGVDAPNGSGTNPPGTLVPPTGNVINAAESRVDYANGSITVVFSTAPAAGTRIAVDYRYNGEGSRNLPEMDVLITAYPAEVVTRRMRIKWGVEAAASAKNQFDFNIGNELAMATANEIKYEIDAEISQLIKQISYTPSQSELESFDITPAAGVPYYLHKEGFMRTLYKAAGIIESRSGKGTGNFIIGGLGFATFVRTLADFVGVPFLVGRGMRKIGNLKGMMDIYYDPAYAEYEWVMGYKGDSWLTTGIVYAPYIAFYATPEIIQDDLMIRRAMYSSYCLKPVNPLFYLRSTLVET